MGTLTASGPLPAAKLTPPRLPGETLMRPRLHALLDRGVQSTLTLVSAPAGFGKTTLLADWGRTPTEARSVRWVALDADDNGRARLLQSISTALGELLVPPLRHDGFAEGGSRPARGRPS